MAAIGFVTDFADLGMLLPVAGLIALGFTAIGRWQVVFAWLLAVAGTLAAMVVLKVMAFTLAGFAPAGPVPAEAWWPGSWLGAAGLGNPSGHTAAGSVFYGGLALLVGERLAWRTLLGLLTAVMAGLIFGTTRLLLGVHSVPDVLVGGLVGLAGVLLLTRLAVRRRPEGQAKVPGKALVLAVATCGALIFHGNRLNAEGLLRSIAAEIRLVSLWRSPGDAVLGPKLVPKFVSGRQVRNLCARFGTASEHQGVAVKDCDAQLGSTSV